LISAVKDGDPGAGARGSLRAAGLISSLTLVSRILGLAREQVFAALLGVGLHADAFQIAFRIPNLLRDLFAEGALSAAFIPTYARALADEGRSGANRLVSRVLTLLGVVLGLVVLLSIAAAPALVRLLAPGFEEVPGKSELTVLLTRIMMPFLPLVSFAAIAMGMLNAEERYGLPAFSPAMFNMVTIAWGGLLWGLGLSLEQITLGWAVGTLVGGAAQFLIQIPGLRRSGWVFRPEWAPGAIELRRMGALMAPATMGLAAVQINIFVNSYFASFEPGAVACLGYAFRILYLPIGLFGVAVGTVATTGFARRAAAGDLEGLRATLSRSLSMLAFLTIPATAGLLVLARPVVRLLYERGAFAAEGDATERTAIALMFYGIGLVAYTGVKVLAPAFYALGAPRLPLMASAAAVLTNLIVNLTLYPSFGFRSVALGTSLAAWVNVAILAFDLERRVGGFRATFRNVGRMLAAAGTMAVSAAAAAHVLESWVGERGISAQLITGLAPVALGVLVYAGASVVMRIPEAAVFREAFQKVTGRGAKHGS
jgi:putative peptidoglycan lipid II flippase